VYKIHEPKQENDVQHQVDKEEWEGHHPKFMEEKALNQWVL